MEPICCQSSHSLNQPDVDNWIVERDSIEASRFIVRYQGVGLSMLQNVKKMLVKK
jgi:hypothetical protein